MAKKRGKKKAQMGSDRISQLPDPIIYHILSFVPTLDVVRMSLLSRRWRRVWYSVPTLRFSDVGYRRRPQVFDAFVENCFMHRDRALRYIADSAVTRLELNFQYDYRNPASLKKWLSSPIARNGIEELNVCAERERFARYCSKPLVVVSGRSLVTVKLKGLRWDDSCPVNLPSLKCLCLDRVSISCETLHSLVAGCPSLEKCLFEFMSGISDLKISSSSLKFLEIEGTFISVKVEAVNLRSLVIYDFFWPSLDISACTEISDLSLSGRIEVNQSLADQISKLALLENLSLTLHNMYEEAKISSLSLKTLSVTKIYQRGLKIITETPNLVSFRYNGTVNFSMLMEAPNQLNGLFSIARPYGEDCDRYWYNWLKTFFSNINFPWNSICLDVHDHKELIVPKALRTRRSPLPGVKHMKVVSHVELTRESELRNSLKWVSPSLETLSIEKGGICECMKWVSRKWEEEQKLSIRRRTRSSGPLQAR